MPDIDDPRTASLLKRQRVIDAQLRRLKPRETDIQRACLQYLQRVIGLTVWRQNVGGMVDQAGHRVKFGITGAADITGCLPDGRRLEIEIKTPSGKQSDAQKRFQARMERTHAVYLLVRSLLDLQQQIAPYLR